MTINERVRAFEKWVDGDVHDTWISYTDVVERYRTALQETRNDTLKEVEEFVRKQDKELYYANIEDEYANKPRREAVDSNDLITHLEGLKK